MLDTGKNSTFWIHAPGAHPLGNSNEAGTDILLPVEIKYRNNLQL